MSAVLAAMPLRSNAVNQPYAFEQGISIRALSPILWHVVPNSYISDHDQRQLERTKYWLCVESTSDASNVATDRLYEAAQHASLALQIICPIGAKHTFLRFEETPKGWDNTGSFHPRELTNTLLGRTRSLEGNALTEHFDAVYAGIRRAAADRIARLRNPVALLEHGMQIGDSYLGTLMFVMALDMLFMAGELAVFVKRVGGFLGVRSLIFPPSSRTRTQPKTTVGEVLRDLYDLRNVVAHGQAIPQTPYWEPYELKSTNGDPVIHQRYYYFQLLHEASQFMLTTALRRIFTEGLFHEITNQKQWRTKIKEYERQYKEDGGPEVTKTRGR